MNLNFCKNLVTENIYFFLFCKEFSILLFFNQVWKTMFEKDKKSSGQVMCVIGMQSEQASLVQALLDLHDKTQSSREAMLMELVSI